jgi:hypothetical protein
VDIYRFLSAMTNPTRINKFELGMNGMVKNTSKLLLIFLNAMADIIIQNIPINMTRRS